MYSVSPPETEFTSALVSHLYGVFPTHGFPNDTFFPSTYSIGEVVLENSGCAVNNKVNIHNNNNNNNNINNKVNILFSSWNSFAV